MKIDITKIEGYRDGMTAEEKLTLLGEYEIPDPDYSGYVKKDVSIEPRPKQRTGKRSTMRY